jgi:membrane protein implicated in regulation of membrane protease activity
MEKSVLIYAGVFLVILVVVVEILIAKFARRRESSDRGVNVSATQHD